MKRVLLALSLTTAALTACDDYGYEQSDAPPVVIEAAPAAEDAGADVVEVAPEPEVPSDPVPVLPPDEATSEESVTPESETLFY